MRRQTRPTRQLTMHVEVQVLASALRSIKRLRRVGEPPFFVVQRIHRRRGAPHRGWAVAAAWSDKAVVRRWRRLFPPRDKARQPIPVSAEWVRWRLQDGAWVANARKRLQSLSWFIKCLKEPLARMANRQDGARGAFFESRYKFIKFCSVSVHGRRNPSEGLHRLATQDYAACPCFRPVLWPRRRRRRLSAQ
jgi:hypothetical protein